MDQIELFEKSPAYVEGWSSFFEMINSFEDIYLDKKEYLTGLHQGKPNTYVAEKRKVLDAILASPKYQGIRVLLACYTQEYYEGSAFVLFLQDGRLFEVNGTHCSCYGLEGQWEPELTTVQDLRFRLSKGTLGTGYNNQDVFATKLATILNTLEAEIISLP